MTGEEYRGSLPRTELGIARLAAVDDAGVGRDFHGVGPARLVFDADGFAVRGDNRAANLRRVVQANGSAGGGEATGHHDGSEQSMCVSHNEPRSGLTNRQRARRRTNPTGSRR